MDGPRESVRGQLHEHGLALKNQGDIDQQAIAGACATGTHGTGRNLQNLSASVMGASIVLASGEQVDCDSATQPELWRAAQLSLGAVGLITRITLQLQAAYKLKETGFTQIYDEIVPRVPELINDSERFEFFWYPQSDMATAKVINNTTEDAQYPVAAEGSRIAWNYEVLPNHRPHFHTEMEYSVPAECGLECFAEIRALLKNSYPDVAWPLFIELIKSDKYAL